MRRTVPWISAVLLLLLAGVLMDSGRAHAMDGLRQAGLADSVPKPGERLRATVLLQLSDCGGNLRMLDLLARADIPERLRLSTIWYVGNDRDTVSMRQLLPRWSRLVPLQRAPPRVLKELAFLGHKSTPVLVLFDQEGRVRLTSQSPRTPREFAGLRHAIEGLTWIGEL
jgi:hypothetical protein